MKVSIDKHNTKEEALKNVYGGTGWHYVKSGAYTWENNTKIGTTW